MFIFVVFNTIEHDHEFVIHIKLGLFNGKQDPSHPFSEKEFVLLSFIAVQFNSPEVPFVNSSNCLSCPLQHSGPCSMHPLSGRDIRGKPTG